MKKIYPFFLAAILMFAVTSLSHANATNSFSPSDSVVIKVCPNPVFDRMEIKANINLSDAVIKVYDETGQQIFERKFGDGVVYLNQNKRPLRQALYFLRVTDHDGTNYPGVKFIRFK